MIIIYDTKKIKYRLIVEFNNSIHTYYSLRLIEYIYTIIDKQECDHRCCN
jgi:hypothetical protein